jgi:hypothetical protein
MVVIPKLAKRAEGPRSCNLRYREISAVHDEVRVALREREERS